MGLELKTRLRTAWLGVIVASLLVLLVGCAGPAVAEYHSDKNLGVGGNTYREPAAYTVQYFDRDAWVDVPAQARHPASPMPNYNRVDFPPVKAQHVRVMVTPQAGYRVGLKELQVFDTHQRRGSP